MVNETEPEDVDDPEQGQDAPSKPSCELTPSSRGRQRKKNCKYADYDTTDKNEHQIDDESPSRKPSPKAKSNVPNPGKTPAKRGRPRKVPLATVDVCKSPHVPNGDTVTQTNVTAVPLAEGSLENGAPKPKRKYVKRKTFTLEPVIPREEDIKEEPEELELGVRPRRSAAKMAMKFLHAMAENDVPNATSDDVTDKPTPETTEKENSKVKKGRKRKCSDGDAADDKDFVPVAAEMAEEEEEEEEDGEEEPDSDSEEKYNVNSCRTPKILPLLETVTNHKKFRHEQLSGWVFPDWLPSSRVWRQVPSSELETYLPQEHLSVDFKVSRDCCGDKTLIQRLGRFEALPAHPQGWDMHLYTGGPVWAMEWCPMPDNAVASQYLAIACHRNMDDQHFYHETYSGPALVQLWEVGTLEYNTRPSSKPALVYGLVMDYGFIRNLKWCPSGGWELPTTQKEAPLLPRLGLLAVGSSSGIVTIYSLPHPDALRASHDHPDSGDSNQPYSIYKPDPVVTLKLGSLKAPHLDRSGQVLCMDWLPVKPHDVIAVGFYDGIVGLWDLNTKSALLRIKESHDATSLFPYKCFVAHDHAVRALTFCSASRHFMATAGEDRLVKTWDLRRLYGPVTVQRRSLINEICWPVTGPGLLWAQDVSFAANNTNGVHFVDHQMNSYFAIPRTTTIWSISYSDWLNCVVTADMLGEVIISTLPSFASLTPYLKKSVERRFPVYMTSMEPHEAEGGQEVCAKEEKDNDEAGSSEGLADVCQRPREVFKEAMKKYYLHHTDNNMVKIFNKASRLWKRMRHTEFREKLNMDQVPLASLHKVRLNPNLNCHTWIASGGRTGLVRLICIRGLINKDMCDLINRSCDGPL
ncbi:general transcription factor 3C polypeptide 2 [Corythoichthys intestinalis]|uniref:general transcription factor 3C polypeptide 2 n=1 Tax=Corythoichthys intestinalis TaxID=161448 RepID=UPI0025A526AD|nr:general transcription factor 3C polypeptide 2 [Corythoichthys intestinalis]XP_057678779.1 general transcription factor 3C polypeptide 2 [Corythoichthys intestinalis]